jgi:hypothetical protein
LKQTASNAPLLLQLDGVHSSYYADSGSRDRVDQGGAGSSRGGTASRVKESTGGMAIKVGAISGGNKATGAKATGAKAGAPSRKKGGGRGRKNKDTINYSIYQV